MFSLVSCSFFTPIIIARSFSNSRSPLRIRRKNPRERSAQKRPAERSSPAEYERVMGMENPGWSGDIKNFDPTEREGELRNYKDFLTWSILAAAIWKMVLRGYPASGRITAGLRHATLIPQVLQIYTPHHGYYISTIITTIQQHKALLTKTMFTIKIRPRRLNKPTSLPTKEDEKATKAGHQKCSDTHGNKKFHNTTLIFHSLSNYYCFKFFITTMRNFPGWLIRAIYGGAAPRVAMALRLVG